MAATALVAAAAAVVGAGVVVGEVVTAAGMPGWGMIGSGPWRGVGCVGWRLRLREGWIGWS